LDVLKWLQKQDTYTLHKPVRKKFKRNRYFVTNIDEIWQADLIDVRSISKYNDGFNYILIIIDIFSRYGWAVQIKNKTPLSVKNAFSYVFKTSKRKPLKLNTDKGLEFTSLTMRNFLRDNKIHFYTSQNPDVKACLAERLIRTLKSSLYKYFTFKNTKRYINVLQDIVQSYNSTVHSSINKAPKDVNENNILEVWRYLYKDLVHKKNSKTSLFKKGDKVRISKYRGQFSKGYFPNWSDEIFIIDKVIKREPLVYRLKDLSKEIIIGTFYSEEIQKVIKTKKDVLK
jgi:hypothetical protein